MEEERRPRRWVRRIKRLLLVSAGGLLLLFLALQVLLATPWLRDRVAEKLSQRLGLDVEIGGLGWTPWGGGTVREFVILQPGPVREHTDEPLLRIAEIRVSPHYRSCARGDWWVERIEVRDPVLSVSVEMLISLAAAGLPSQDPPPVIAAVDPSKARPQEPGPEPPSIVGCPESGHDGGQGVAGNGAAPGVPIKSSANQKKRTFEAIVRNGSCKVFSIGQNGDLVALDGLDVDIVGTGDVGSGRARLSTLKMLQQTMETSVGVELELVAGVLSFVIQEDAEKDRQLTGNGNVGMRRGFPFQASVGYESSEPSKLMIPGLGELDIEENQTFVQCMGLGRVPMSWRALLRAGGEGVELKEAGLGFDRYEAAMVLRNGVFQVPDFRLLGDQASLLGNGWVNRESGSGVVRLVVSSAAAEWVKARLGVERMESLDPGNRQFLDVDFWRDPSGWMADLDGRTVPLSEIGLSGR